MHMSVRLTGQSLLAAAGFPKEPDWRRLGNELRLRVIQRTTHHGLDADLQPFEPYSEGYKKQLQKVAHPLKVDLVSTRAGLHMMNDIQVRVQATKNPRVVLEFGTSNPDKKHPGSVQKAMYAMYDGRVLRKFFALSDQDIEHAHWFVKQLLAGK